jgi:NTP pyrophosphatase (non-canonical NTP hydrolase)
MSEYVPEITDERLAELLSRIRATHQFGSELCYIKPVDPRGIAFTWDPKKDEKADKLKVLRSILTYHNYGHPSLFKPSIAEVLAQIPEDIVERVVAFQIPMNDAIFDSIRDCHVATTILYEKADEPGLLDKYRTLKQKLIRIRDERRLHSCAAQNEEDAILDEMDTVWYKMSDEEHKELDGGWDCCCGSLNYMAREIAKWSVSKGWETNWWNVPEKLMLIVTELAEAMEEYRELGGAERRRLEDERKLVIKPGHYPLDHDTVRMEHYPKFREEIADAVIRLLNLSASLGIDIEAEIAAKMKKNEKRPFKHGGKNC